VRGKEKNNFIYEAVLEISVRQKKITAHEAVVSCTKHI